QGGPAADRDLLRRARCRGGIPLRQGSIQRPQGVRTLAFIGLGSMGQPMAANLAKEGFAVRSFDLNGTGSSPSVRDAAAGAEVVITMLPDGEAVRKAVLEALPALDSGTVVVDMSSSDPAATRALGTMLAARGIELVDAPVSGAVPKAIDGTLTIMAGGNAATLKRITPLLEKMGDRVFHVGPLGAGHAVKALNNYLGAAGTLAGFEALLIARAYGPRGCVDRHVAPPEGLTRGERAQQLAAVREAERQAALRERSRRRHQPADHGIAALAVKNFAGEQIFLGHRDGVGAPAGRAAGRLGAQSDRRHRNSHLEADQVPALVHAGVAARGIGFDPVLHEAALDVFAFGFEHHENAEADVVGD